MRMQILGLGLTIAILLNGTAGASAGATGCASPPAELGKFQPAVEGSTLPQQPYLDADGAERPLEEPAGRGLVLNFWATWCAPCVKEMPALDRLAAVAPGHGFHVLALSADREGAAVVRKFYEVNGITHLPVALDKMSRVARPAGVAGLPTSVLYDARAREVGRVVGVAEWDAPAVVEFLGRCLAVQN